MFIVARLRVVLSCIVDDKGGNSLLESKHGKLFHDATNTNLVKNDDMEDENDIEAFTFDNLEDLDDSSDD